MHERKSEGLSGPVFLAVSCIAPINIGAGSRPLDCSMSHSTFPSCIRQIGKLPLGRLDGAPTLSVFYPFFTESSVPRAGDAPRSFPVPFRISETEDSVPRVGYRIRRPRLFLPDCLPAGEAVAQTSPLDGPSTSGGSPRLRAV